MYYLAAPWRLSGRVYPEGRVGKGSRSSDGKGQVTTKTQTLLAISQETFLRFLVWFGGDARAFGFDCDIPGICPHVVLHCVLRAVCRAQGSNGGEDKGDADADEGVGVDDGRDADAATKPDEEEDCVSAEEKGGEEVQIGTENALVADAAVADAADADAAVADAAVADAAVAAAVADAAVADNKAEEAQGSVPLTRDEAAIRIQKRARGMIGRKQVRLKRRRHQKTKPKQGGGQGSGVNKAATAKQRELMQQITGGKKSSATSLVPTASSSGPVTEVLRDDAAAAPPLLLRLLLVKKPHLQAVLSLLLRLLLVKKPRLYLHPAEKSHCRRAMSHHRPRPRHFCRRRRSVLRHSRTWYLNLTAVRRLRWWRAWWT